MEIEELFCKRYPEYSVNGKPLHPYFDVFEEGYEQAEKENTELKEKLKEKLKTIADKDLSFVAKFDALEKENAELNRRLDNLFNSDCWASEKLTKAKEIIKELVRVEYADFTNGDYSNELSKVLEQAEQFLKGENIILEDAQAGNSPFDADEVFNKEMKAYPEEK